jgi:cation:H+ antiporter
VIKPFHISARLAGTDYWIMVAVSVIFALTTALGVKKITRVGGTILLSCYVGYMVYLFVFTATV